MDQLSGRARDRARATSPKRCAFITHVWRPPTRLVHPAADSPNTSRLIVEDSGFLYDSDEYGDDLPGWVTDHGRPQFVVPYTLDTNDMRFATPQGFNTGEQFFTYLKDTFDALYAEGETRRRCCRSACIAA